MDTSNKPEDMKLDDILAEIMDISKRQGNTEIAILIAKSDSTKVNEIAEQRLRRLLALCNEIFRRAEGGQNERHSTGGN